MNDFLQAACDSLARDGYPVTPENLVNVQRRYTLDQCQDFLSEKKSPHLSWRVTEKELTMYEQTFTGVVPFSEMKSWRITYNSGIIRCVFVVPIFAPSNRIACEIASVVFGVSRNFLLASFIGGK